MRHAAAVLLAASACTGVPKAESADAVPTPPLPAPNSEAAAPGDGPAESRALEVGEPEPAGPPAGPPVGPPAGPPEPRVTVSDLGDQDATDPLDCPFAVTTQGLPAINPQGTSLVRTSYAWDTAAEDSNFSYVATWRGIGRRSRSDLTKIYRATKAGPKGAEGLCATQHAAARKAATKINARLARDNFRALTALDVERVFPQEEHLRDGWTPGGRARALKLPEAQHPVRARLHHDAFTLELPGETLLRERVDLEAGHRIVCHGDPFVRTVWGDRELGLIALEYEVESATCNMPGFILFHVADEVFEQVEQRPTRVLRDAEL